MSFNLKEILAHMPAETRHLAIAKLPDFSETRITTHRTTLTEEETIAAVPTEMLREALDYFITTGRPDGIYDSEYQSLPWEFVTTKEQVIYKIAGEEGMRREDPELMRMGAEAFEKAGQPLIAAKIFDYGLKDFRRAAECIDIIVKKIDERVQYLIDDDRPSDGIANERKEMESPARYAGALWEAVGEWENASWCYERGGRGFGGTLNKAIEMAEKYNVDRAIKLALGDKETQEPFERKESLITAANVAARHERYDEAIAFCEQSDRSDINSIKAHIAGIAGHKKDAVTFYVAARDFLPAARLSREIGVEEECPEAKAFAQRLYGLLFKRVKRKKRENNERAEGIALEGELWEELATYRLEYKGFRRGRCNWDLTPYEEIRKGNTTPDVLQPHLEEALRAGDFVGAALFATYLGDENAPDYRRLGMITPKERL